MNFNAINETIKLLVLFKIDEIIFRIFGCSFGTPYRFSFNNFSIFPIKNKLKIIISIKGKLIDLLIFYFTIKLKKTSKRLNIFERILVYVLMRTNSDTNVYSIHTNRFDRNEQNQHGIGTIRNRRELPSRFHGNHEKQRTNGYEGWLLHRLQRARHLGKSCVRFIEWKILPYCETTPLPRISLYEYRFFTFSL